MAYEDFTTYTEFDEGSDVTVDSAAKVSWVLFRPRYSTYYLYKDKGVNHFSGDFNHKVECYFSVMYYDWPFYAHWMIANIVGDMKDVADAAGDAHVLRVYDPKTGSKYFQLVIIENGVATADTSIEVSLSTLYFVEIVRDDDGGANNTGRLTAYIRTGSHTGVLIDTLVVDSSVGEQNDFRYIYALASYDTSSNYSTWATGYTQNLDIGEAPPGWTGTICGVTNPAKINGIAVANIAKVNGV